MLSQEDIRSGLDSVRSALESGVRVKRDDANRLLSGIVKKRTLTEMFSQGTLGLIYEPTVSLSGADEWLTPAHLSELGDKLVKLSSTGIALEKTVFLGFVESIVKSAKLSTGLPSTSDNKEPTSVLRKSPKKDSDDFPDVMTEEQAAKFLGFEKRLMGVMRREGTGPAWSKPRREYRYQKTDLIEWLNKQKHS